MLVDLHVHSALSACAENIMSPRRVLEKAAQAGIRVLAITDHNASAHAVLTVEMAAAFNLTVMPAMEVSSREDVHVLAFFPKVENLENFQELVDAHLPDLDGFTVGDQVIYDKYNEIIDIDAKPRHFGLSLGLNRLVEEIHRRGGRAVPSHVHRSRFSLTSQLGLIPPDGAFDAVELDWHEWRAGKWAFGRTCEGYPAITASDAHVLDDVGAHAMQVPKDSLTFDTFFDNLTIDN